MSDSQRISELRVMPSISPIKFGNFIRLGQKRRTAFVKMLSREIRPYSALKEIYANRTEQYDPYLVDWIRIFTPIEYDAWDTIRGRALPFYPQYPMDGIILDFADPIKKIAIECDGKEWHDAETDKAIDEKLFKKGWAVYRVTGRECRKAIDDPAELKELLDNGTIDEQEHDSRYVDWLMNTSEGVITSIATIYYEQGRLNHSDAIRSLSAHTYSRD